MVSASGTRSVPRLPASAAWLALGAAPAGGAREALARDGYPWYDAKADGVKPLLPWPDYGSGWGKWWTDLGNRVSGWFEPLRGWFRWLNGWRVPGIGGLGDLVAVGLAMLLLTLVVVLLLELIRRYRPLKADAGGGAGAVPAGRAQRIVGLPAGVRLDAVDPWAEAQRRRAAGDLAGAVVYLFGYQLLTLDRLRQTRLIPGRTGRQLVRAVADPRLRASVEPTLRLFEAVYYGGRPPAPDAFESVWERVGDFRRLAEGFAVGGAATATVEARA